MTDNIWGPRPLQSVVVEILQKRGAMPDTDLHKELKESFGDVSFRELNRILMKLELTGVVRVSRLLKKKRRVELVIPEKPS
jgi:Fe2+ or Zn2+ uptake regulation protein